MNLNPFYKPDPESLYKDDIGLFLQHLHERNRAAGSFLSDIAGSLSSGYSSLGFSEAEKRKLIESAVARLLRNIAGRKNRQMFGDTLSEFEDYFNAKYIHVEFYKKYYKQNLDALYQALAVKNDAAWELFLEIAYQKVEAMGIFQDIADFDEQKEVLQVTTEKFMEDVSGDGFDVGKAEYSVASMVSFFSTIAYRECANYFRRIKKFSSLENDIKDDIGTEEERDEPESDQTTGYETDFMADDILTFASIADNNADEEEKAVGIIIKSSVKEWTKEALRDCLDRLHQADLDLASKMKRDIHHWRRLVEYKIALGKSHQDVSKLLDISATNSANRLARAIQLLKICMNSKGIYHS